MAPIAMKEWDELRSTKESAKRLARAVRNCRREMGDDPSKWFPKQLQTLPADLEAELARVRELERIARG